MEKRVLRRIIVCPHCKGNFEKISLGERFILCPLCHKSIDCQLVFGFFIHKLEAKDKAEIFESGLQDYIAQNVLGGISYDTIRRKLANALTYAYKQLQLNDTFEARGERVFPIEMVKLFFTIKEIKRRQMK